MSEGASGRRRNWRYREKRLNTSVLAKRVSREDHDLVVAYARSLNTTVAELLDPAVTELITRASAYMARVTVDSSELGDHE
ncbi:conserved hypothetical protein [Mycolicibacterium vanbaalenii PYR-1]|jgi:hypothetical protein|uniref:Uncharacterized protein n=1 Tax=Mycolicibacterium vanbaalenii (strain DSM 7251 / JCM 13017 / BCRC 16820 / KCTC 9966 / NRRL B-24157 / PYR-1) TaxID=350058 RepID=A1TBH6_MYCVP|nr:conserved hypothetical protein [Mycolicibacterium vanbaalenii PYR-1]